MFLAAAFVLLLGGGDAPSSALPWGSDWDKAFEQARVEQKLVIVDFFAWWCGPCQVMDREVIPDPRVQEQLASLVRLRIDIHRSNIDERLRVIAYPTFIVYDPWENERFRMEGADPPTLFSDSLKLINGVAPRILAASRRIHDGAVAEGELSLGMAYLRANIAAKARECFGRARTQARNDGNTALAYAAEIQNAFAWVIDRKPKKAVAELLKLEPSAPDADARAATWLAIGHARLAAGDKPGASDAFQRGLAAATSGSAVQKELELALARR